MMLGARLFICYSHEFAEEAQAIVSRVGGFASQVFIDRYGVIVGDHVSARIWWHARTCDAAIVVIDPRFRETGYRQWEFRALWRRFGSNPAGRLLPVLVAGARPSDVPRELEGIRALTWGGGGELELSEAIEKLVHRRRRWSLASATLLIGAVVAAALVRDDVVGFASTGAGSETVARDPVDEPLEEAAKEDLGATGTLVGGEAAESGVPDAPTPRPVACRRDADCTTGQRCHRPSEIIKERLEPSVVKAVDRRTHSKIVGQRCQGGASRIGEPLYQVTPGGRCELEWRAPLDAESCEVDAVAEGPSHQEIRCTVFVRIRRRGQGMCTQ